MNRLTFQRLAEERLVDARALAQAERFAAAYYLAGYAVECALKACICRMTSQHDFPPKEAKDLYIHDLAKLATKIDEIPGVDWRKELDSNSQLRQNWLLTKDWREDARYRSKTEREALDLISAIEDDPDGVLACLRKHW